MDSPRELVPNHLDVDGLAHAKPDGSNEVLIYPGLQLTHPKRTTVSKLKRVKAVKSDVVSQGSAEHDIMNREKIATLGASSSKQ